MIGLLVKGITSMSRSLKKGPYINPKLFKKIEELNKTKEKKIVPTWARDSVVFPEAVGHTIGVHNGRNHTPVYISENMVGHKFGEFSPTRTFRGHGGKRASAEKKAVAKAIADKQTAVLKSP
jgi:small subunit ribosomal protein S19